MKERSVTQRNLWGGFLGGLLGILCFGLINEYLLIIGCLVGVVGGYWYQEIWQIICDDWVETKATWQEMYTNTMEALHLIASDSAKFLKRYEMNVDFHKFLKYFVIPLIHFLDIRNSTVVKWFMAHPMNRAYSVRVLAAITLTSLHMIWYVPLCKFWFSTLDSENPGSFILFMLLAVILFCIMLIVPFSTFSEEKTLKDMKFFYKYYEKYSQKNVFYTYFYDMVGITAAQFFVILSGLGLLSYTLLAGALVSTVIFLPVIAFLLIIKSIYHITLRPNHWLCLSVTLVVTTISALLTKPYLESTIILWLVALATGCLSGLATEGVRRIIAWDFAQNPRLTNYALATVTTQLTPSGQKFVKTVSWVDEALQQKLNFLRFNI